MTKDFVIEDLAKNLVSLKQEFSHVYNGTSHIQEIIPASTSDVFPIDDDILDSLHMFAKKNPIYYNSYEQSISDVSCIVYEGDINKYWLNSIQHSSSRAPFSPTWIFSACISSLMAKNLGCRQVIDIGSGDGRIAYCSKILGLDSYSIEIDDMLVNLQNSISESTGIGFNPICHDALSFDYSSLNMEHPAFFIGGLAQMGGTVLATGVLENILPDPVLKKNTGIVLVGTSSQKYPPDPMGKYGWGTLIDKFSLHSTRNLTLPTVWSFKEPDDTHYLFTSTAQK